MDAYADMYRKDTGSGWRLTRRTWTKIKREVAASQADTKVEQRGEGWRLDVRLPANFAARSR